MSIKICVYFSKSLSLSLYISPSISSLLGPIFSASTIFNDEPYTLPWTCLSLSLFLFFSVCLCPFPNHTIDHVAFGIKTETGGRVCRVVLSRLALATDIYLLVFFFFIFSFSLAPNIRIVDENLIVCTDLTIWPPRAFVAHQRRGKSRIKRI